jgi:putative hydrolase of the HAD superfamily
MIEAVVFDLDDTLYRERDFVASGYRAVAHYLAKAAGIPAKDIFRAMMRVFSASGRREVFPMVIASFMKDPVPVGELVEIYRNHTPRIRLFPGYDKLLNELRRKHKLGIITDGIPQVQRRKVEALGLEHAVDHIIFTGDYGPRRQKPDPLAFCLMLRRLQVDPGRTVYVGDNPLKDGIGAHRAGVRFAMVSPCGRSRPCSLRKEGLAELTVRSLLELPRILRRAD